MDKYKKEEVIIDILAQLVLEYMEIEEKRSELNSLELMGYSQYITWIWQNKTKRRKSDVDMNQMVQWTIISICKSKNHQE